MRRVTNIMGYGLLAVSCWFLVALPQVDTFAQEKEVENFYSAPELKGPLDQLPPPGPLFKGHAGLEGKENCLKCHVTEKDFDKNKCLKCHQEIAERWDKGLGYHGKFLKGNCIICHKDHKGQDYNPVQLDYINFNHNLAVFPLEGKHRTIDCKDCHYLKSGETGELKIVFLGLSTDCYRCHPSPHLAELSLACTKCHNTNSWKGRDLLFQHNRDSDFKLLGAHIEVKCEACHPVQAGKTLYKPTPKTCAECHEDVHKGLMGKECQTCHTPDKWQSAAVEFDHNKQTEYELTGAHQAVACLDCHPAHRNKLEDTGCAACHEDVHRGGLTKDCAKCHTTFTWEREGLKFDHNRDTIFKLEGAHRDVNCEKCHIDKTFKLVDKRCAACHLDMHKGQLGDDCQRCHLPQAASWEIPPGTFDHDKNTKFTSGKLHRDIECKQCHKMGLSFKLENRTCEACHKEIEQFYAGLSLFKDAVTTTTSPMYALVKCLDCHKPEDSGADYRKLRMRCAQCHNENYIFLSDSWKNFLFIQGYKLEKRLTQVVSKGTKDLYTRGSPEHGPTSLAQVWGELASLIQTSYKVARQIKEQGIHNPWLSLEEINQVKKIVDKLEWLQGPTKSGPIEPGHAGVEEIK